MLLYNTLTRKKEEFTPIISDLVRVYTCGPTVYDYAHIGNLRAYVFADILRRSLEFLGYNVKHAMNITDVGHLTGDADDGDDKVEKGAAKEGIHPLELTKKYEAAFFADCEKINILRPTEVLRATECIDEQIAIIQLLDEAGYVYGDDLALYFDTSKLPDYGKLNGQNQEDRKIGARDEVVVDIKKRQQSDFVLWFFLKGRYENHILQWDSPWGKGFPGWHIECSAISRKLLGQPFDIHTGGVDHIGTHHTNEIAQSEAAFGEQLANYWLHNEHLLIKGDKIAKSSGNGILIKDIEAKGFSPLDLRYFFLQSSYTVQTSFSEESLLASRLARQKLNLFVLNQNIEKFSDENIKNLEPVATEHLENFKNALADNLNTPNALAVAHELLKDPKVDDILKARLLLKFDEVLALNLDSKKTPPEGIEALKNELDAARQSKDYKKSDEIRDQIISLGGTVENTANSGSKIFFLH